MIHATIKSACDWGVTGLRARLEPLKKVHGVAKKQQNYAVMNPVWLHPFDDPVDQTNQQTKQHETPKVNKYICDSLLISFSVTHDPIEAHNHKANAENPHEYFKKQI